MSTGRPPIALSMIDDDHQGKCLKLRRRLTDQQAAAFERFLSFRSLHLLTWLYRCFPSLEGQLQRGALPAIMRVDPVVKLSPSSIHRGLLFDKRRLWVCTDTYLMVFREDGAMKVQVAIADIAEIIHIKVAVPVPMPPPSASSQHQTSAAAKRKASVYEQFLGEQGISSGEYENNGGDNNVDDEEELDPSEMILPHRPTSVCHALVLRSPGKRDVGAFFGPSPIALNLIIQYILSRRRVAIVNYAMKTGSTALPPSAAQEAVVTRPSASSSGSTMDPLQLVQYVQSRGVFLKRPAGSATSVTMSAPSVPLVTNASSAVVEVALGTSVYQEALREVESNATRCREETADATCSLLASSHIQYAALLRSALSTQNKTDVMAGKLRRLRADNSERHEITADKLKETRAQIQRYATEMLAMTAMHGKSVQELRTTCLESEDRSKQSLVEANEDDERTTQTLQQLTQESLYLEEQIQLQSAKLNALESALPMKETLADEIAQLQAAIEGIVKQRAAAEKALGSFAEETNIRTGLVVTPRVGHRTGSSYHIDPHTGDISDLALNLDHNGSSNHNSPTRSLLQNASPARDVNFNDEEALQRHHNQSLLKQKGLASLSTLASASVLHQEEVLMLEEQAMAAMERRRQEIDFLGKARIAHGNESIIFKRKKERCERLADSISDAVKREKAAADAAIDLRRDIDRLQRRIKLLPLESLLCDDLKRTQVIEASVERSVRLGASPAGLKSSEEVMKVQLSHLNSIRDRMQSAVDRIASPSVPISDMTAEGDDACYGRGYHGDDLL